MRTLHIIMPMAGEGSRFKKEGWETPKPLISLHGIPLFLRAINSVVTESISAKYSFIVREEHIHQYHIDNMILMNIPGARIFSVEKTTRGAVETCLVAETNIGEDDAIIVMDCDLEFKSSRFDYLIKESLSQKPEDSIKGVLVSFNSNSPKYSYAEIDNNGMVVRTAEKEVISSHALCGAYFFGSGSCFLSAAHALLKEPCFKKPEYYVSLLYNKIIREGGDVRLAEMEEYYSYGTPEELKKHM